MKAPLFSTLACLLFSACSTPEAPLATAPNFEPACYAGVWHEIARLPNRFERDVVAARATYRKLDDGNLSILNEGLKSTGKETSISGIATPAGEAKFKIRFDKFPANLFVGNYWVLWVDDSYERAIVRTPSRKFLWLLAKDPAIQQKDFAPALKEMKGNGFAIEQIYENPKRLN